MPCLRDIWLVLDSHKWDKATPLGLQYLWSLKKIIVFTVVNYSDAGTSDKESEMSEAALVSKVFQEAADAHPSHPAFDFRSGIYSRYEKLITDLLHASACFCYLYLQAYHRSITDASTCI